MLCSGQSQKNFASQGHCSMLVAPFSIQLCGRFWKHALSMQCWRCTAGRDNCRASEALCSFRQQGSERIAWLQTSNKTPTYTDRFRSSTTFWKGRTQLFFRSIEIMGHLHLPRVSFVPRFEGNVRSYLVDLSEQLAKFEDWRVGEIGIQSNTCHRCWRDNCEVMEDFMPTRFCNH